MDIQQIVKAWELDESKYTELGRAVSSFIKSTITDFGILPEVSHRTKELLSIIKKIKKKLKEKHYTYSDLNDKLGVRIICTFQEDMETADTFLKQYFIIKKVERKREELDSKTLGYTSNHYDATINPSIKQFAQFARFSDLIFEIQVRTFSQHAWAIANHALSYKRDDQLVSRLDRKLYRLLSLYEIADDEISAVNRELIANKEDNSFAMLRMLEGKIFMFAQIDFDRESSLNSLAIIFTYLNEKEINKSFDEIESFIELNKEKIKSIFESNRSRYHEIPTLTQPEIFLIWFGLQHFPYSIRDNWHNDFDIDELNEITNLWGRIIE